MSIRKATSNDLSSIAILVEQRRLQYQEYQPTFWRKAKDAQEKHTLFLESLLKREDVIMLVCEDGGKLNGFIIADFVDAPPVYDPGGPTCRVDDFCVASANLWESVGKELLNEVRKLAKDRGATQNVVICGHLDQPKRSMLALLSYSIASEWYVQDL